MARLSTNTVATVSIPPYALRDKQAAEVIGVSVGLLRKWRLFGRGPRYSKIGGVILYRLKDLEEFVDDSHKNQTGTQ